MFLARVSELAASQWRRDPVVEQDANGLGQGLGCRYIYFVPADGTQTDIIFLYMDGLLKLVNVITDGDGISHATHARITGSLWKAGMKQACKEFQLKGTYTPTQTVRPEAGLPPDVITHLDYFAKSVNKADGAAHPDDIKAWCRFLIALHVSGARFDEDLMFTYLEEKKFPDTAIFKLCREMEVASRLLRLYDHTRAAMAKAAVQ